MTSKTSLLSRVYTTNLRAQLVQRSSGTPTVKCRHIHIHLPEAACTLHHRLLEALYILHLHPPETLRIRTLTKPQTVSSCICRRPRLTPPSTYRALVPGQSVLETAIHRRYRPPHLSVPLGVLVAPILAVTPHPQARRRSLLLS